jgi:hypothetical protein
MDRRRPAARGWALALLAGLVTLAIVAADVALSTLPSFGPSVPRTAAVYGSGIAADALANTQIGGTSCDCPNLRTSFRFEARRAATLSAIRIYLITETDGYASGSGGTITVSLRPDDGTPEHHPGDAVLASAEVAHEAFPRVAFATPAALDEGGLYHLVFTNTDPAPTENFISINSLFVDPPITPRQAQYSDVDWAQLIDYGDGWRVRPEYTPILQLEWSDGLVDGVGYMETWIGAAKVISGPAQARESFTVGGGDLPVSRIVVRIARLSGDGALDVRLERDDGDLVGGGAIPASTMPLTDAGTDAQPTWVSLTLPAPVTLLDRARYHLVVATDRATRYQVHVIRKGVAVGFRAPTFFPDGYAEFDPGTGWVAFDPGWRGPLAQADLQFYLD